MADCIKALTEKYPGLKKQEIKRLVETMNNLKSQFAQDRAAYIAMSKKAVNEFEMQRLIQQKIAVNSLAKKAKNLQFMSDPAFEGKTLEAIEARIIGTTRPAQGSTVYVESVYNSNVGRWTSQMFRELESFNFKSEAWSGQFDEMVADEIYNRIKPNYTPSSVPEIVQFANTIEKLNKNLIKMQQDAGSAIQYKPGYIFGSSHDPEKILANVDQWIEDTIPLIDGFESLGTGLTDAQIRTKLGNIAESLDDIGMARGQGKGGKRQIVWKSGADFMKYQSKYGFHNLMTGITRSIDVASKRSAMVQFFGDNPFEMIEDLIGTARGIGGVDLVSGEKSVRNAVEYLRNTGNQISNPKSFGARVGYPVVRALKTANILSYLGRTGFTSLNDLGNIMISLKTYDGQGLLQSMGNTMKGVIEGFGGNRAELARSLEISIGDITREVSELIPSNAKPGFTSKILEKYMWMNGTKTVTNLSRKTTMLLQAEALTSHVKIPGAELNINQVNMRKSLGITDKDAESLAKLVESSGEKYITPDLIRESGLPNADKLAQAIAAQYNVVVREGSPLGGWKEDLHFFQSKHLPKDNPQRIAMEFAGQFKNTVLKIMSTNEKALRFSNATPNLRTFNTTQAVGQMVLATTITGYLINELKGLALGKDTGDVSLAKIRDAQLSSGAAGFYVDYVTNAYLHGGRTQTPAAKTITDLYGIIDKAAIEGQYDKAAEKAVKTIKRNLPGSNLWLFEAINNHIMKEGSYRSKRGRR